MKTRTRLAIGLGTALLAGSTAAVSLGGGALDASTDLVDAGGTRIGWARLVEDSTGIVHVNVHVAGVAPGLHGIHIHSVGACTLGGSPTFGSAGGHHNPLGLQHGLESALGPHAGDLPNLRVNEDGIGHLNVKTDRATLESGTTSIFDGDGSALVIHAAWDDQVTNPTGNSGGRIACGVLRAG